MFVLEVLLQGLLVGLAVLVGGVVLGMLFAMGYCWYIGRGGNRWKG